MGPPGGLERRRPERIPLPGPGGSVCVVGARLVDVSAHGMRIESFVPLEREAHMSFRLVIAGEKVDVEARVVACSLLASGKRRVFSVGLDFTAMPDAARQRLSEALARPAMARVI